MNTKPLIERVKNPVHFIYFRDGALWYEACDGWIFPVPVGDTTNVQGGSPTFHAEEKGMLLMRWMRKQLSREEEA